MKKQKIYYKVVSGGTLFKSAFNAINCNYLTSYDINVTSHAKPGTYLFVFDNLGSARSFIRRTGWGNKIFECTITGKKAPYSYGTGLPREIDDYWEAVNSAKSKKTSISKMLHKYSLNGFSFKKNYFSKHVVWAKTVTLIKQVK